MACKLHRVPVAISVPLISDDIDELCLQAREKIGYKSPGLGHKHFEQALYDLDIRPFDRESVEEYKTKAVKSIMAGERERNTKYKIGNWLVLYGLCSLALCLIGSFLAAKPEEGAFFPCCFICGSIALFVGVGLSSYNLPNVFFWFSTPISEYDKPIPGFALQTALDLKAKCPYAEFFIQELESFKDPFLVAVIDKKPYYLEVWNEPQFEVKRTL